MGQMKAYSSFDAYLKDQPRANQSVIRALRKLVKRTAPSLEEAVKYGNGCWVQGRYPIAYVYAAADPTSGFARPGTSSSGTSPRCSNRRWSSGTRPRRHGRRRSPREKVRP